MVVVCSALSIHTKNDGTTNRLLEAYKHCLKGEFNQFKTLVHSIRLDHIAVAQGYIKDTKIVTNFAAEATRECEQVLQLLNATMVIGHGTFYVKDKILSVGERLACLFLSATLRDRGMPSEVIDLSEICPLIMGSSGTQSSYKITPELMAKRVRSSSGGIPVVTGFFGSIDRGLLAQIGRGYTDFCASMIAVGLSAQELQIWKEVEGIFTADPSKVPNARMLPVISSAEASELTFHGSEVIHYAAMRLAMRAMIPIRIKNVLNPQAAGTLVRDGLKSKESLPMLPPLDNVVKSLGLPHSDADTPTPIAITSKDNILLMNIRSADRLKAHSFFAGVFAVFDKWNLSIDLICTSEVQASLALHSEEGINTNEEEDDSEHASKDFRGAVAQLKEYGNVELLPNRTIVSLVGKRVNQAMGIAGQMFSTLTQNRIKIDMIAQGMTHSIPQRTA